MEVVKMGNKSCLLSHSRIDDDDDDDDVDIDEIDGYDDEFG